MEIEIVVSLNPLFSFIPDFFTIDSFSPSANHDRRVWFDSNVFSYTDRTVTDRSIDKLFAAAEVARTDSREFKKTPISINYNEFRRNTIISTVSQEFLPKLGRTCR